MKTSEAKRLEFRRNLETGTFMIAPGIYAVREDSRSFRS